MIVKITTAYSNSKHQIDDDCTLLMFKMIISEKVKITPWEIELLVGFPPKLLQHASAEQLLTELGVTSGTCITVRPSAIKKSYFDKLKEMGFSDAVIISTLEKVENFSFEEVLELCDNSPLNKKESNCKLERVQIPADNSCLFNSLKYLLKLPESTQDLRQIVAQVIQSDPSMYNEDFLEKPPSEYIKWILQPDKWGGEIEISILSNFFEVKISVIDIGSGIVLPYGNPSFQKMVLLLYDGVHYDALIHRNLRTQETFFQFEARNEQVVEEAIEFAKELRNKKQFVNLTSGQLYCNTCFTVFKGEKEAVEHAKATGHTNFDQK
jgi:ubiquitin thioesterase OTU1